MSCQGTKAAGYEHNVMAFSVKHTFLTLQMLDDDDDAPTLRRSQSEPLLTCATRKRSCKVAAGKIDMPEESATPTTCASVDGDGDDSPLSSPENVQEDGSGGHGTAFSFSEAVVNELVNELLVNELPVSEYDLAISTPEPPTPQPARLPVPQPPPFSALSILSTHAPPKSGGGAVAAMLSTRPSMPPAVPTPPALPVVASWQGCFEGALAQQNQPNAIQNWQPAAGVHHSNMPIEVTEKQQSFTQQQNYMPIEVTEKQQSFTQQQNWQHWQVSEEQQSHSHTTLMVRNLPADLPQQEFVRRFVERGYSGLFDFVYMPMNLRKPGNFGYAFINFTSNAVAMEVMMQTPHRPEHDQSEGWMSAWSTCQGLLANIERYRNSPLMHDTVPVECRPALYNQIGDHVQFPQPTKVISKPRIHWATVKQ